MGPSQAKGTDPERQTHKRELSCGQDGGRNTGPGDPEVGSLAGEEVSSFPAEQRQVQVPLLPLLSEDPACFPGAGTLADGHQCSL